MINNTYFQGNTALNKSYLNSNHKILVSKNKKHKYHLTAKAKQIYIYLAQGLASIFSIIILVFVTYFYFL